MHEQYSPVFEVGHIIYISGVGVHYTPISLIIQCFDFLFCSQWRLVHKGSTYFGPSLWLSAGVAKPRPKPAELANSEEEHITFEPSILALFPPPASPPPSNEGEKLTNENLLKSIGFLPDLNHSSFALDDPPADETSLPMSASTDQLLQTFEMIDNPSYSAGGVSGGVASYPWATGADEEGFVVIVPDCFKPLPDFSPPASFCELEDDTPFQDLDLDPSTTSCDSHVSVSLNACAESTTSQTVLASRGNGTPVPSAVTVMLGEADRDSFQIVPTIPSGDVATPTETPQEVGEGVSGVSPPAANKTSPGVNRRITLRNLKGGLYRNPLAVATGILNAVSGFVDQKVHFAPTTSGEAPTERAENKPCMQFTASDDTDTSDSSEDEFEVSVLLV